MLENVLFPFSWSAQSIRIISAQMRHNSNVEISIQLSAEFRFLEINCNFSICDLIDQIKRSLPRRMIICI